MSQWIYVVRPPRSGFIQDITDAERAVVYEHFGYLKGLFESGEVIFVGRCEDGTFGIAVFQAETEVAAQAIMNGDPAVKAGVFSAELWPFMIAMERGA